MSKAEEYIRKNTNQFSNEDGFDYVPWLTPDQARKAVEIARRDTLLAIKHEIGMCSVKQYQFPILHLLDYIDKELGLKSKEK